MGNKFASIFRRKKEFRVLIQGLDAAGKTTVLYQLKLGEVVTTIPTIGFNVETLEYKQISFTAWDVGGRDKIRPLLRHYYPNTQALIYVVDSSDLERMDELQREIHQALREDELRDTVLLIMANKQDLPGAASVERITELLSLHSIKNHRWLVVPTVATLGDGLYEGLDWIVQTLTQPSTSPQDETTKSAESVTKGKDSMKILTKSWEVFKSLFVA